MPKGCVYFASLCKSTAATILPSTNRICLKAIAPVVVLPHEAKYKYVILHWQIRPWSDG